MVVQASALVLNASVKNTAFKCGMDCEFRVLSHFVMIKLLGGKSVTFISLNIGLLE